MSCACTHQAMHIFLSARLLGEEAMATGLEVMEEVGEEGWEGVRHSKALASSPPHRRQRHRQGHKEWLPGR